MSFLDQSQRAKEAQIEEKEARLKKEYRRSRNFVSVLAIALVASLGLALYAFKMRADALEMRDFAMEQKKEAIHQKETAESQKTIAEENQRNAAAAKKEALSAKEKAEINAAKAQEASNEAEKQRSRAVAALQVANKAKQKAEQSERSAIKAEEDKATEYRRAQKQSTDFFSTISSFADDLIKVNPPRLAIKYQRMKASALSQMGDNQGAIEVLNRALEIMPEDSQLLTDRGSISYAFASNANKTVADLERSNDNSYSAHAYRAISYAQLGRYDKAKEAILSAINSFRYKYDGTSFYDSEVWPAIKALTGKTLLLSEEGDYRIAFLYERANILALDGDEGFVAALQEADQAVQHQEADHRKVPKDVYLTALNWSWLHNRPEDYGGRVSEGALWERFQRPDLARCSYVDFRGKYEKEAEPRYDSLARWVERRLTEIGHSGASDCSKLFSPEDRRADARTLAVDAEVANARGKWIEADNLLSQAIKQEPNNVSLLIQRALVLYGAQQYAESRELCNSILKLAPQTPIAYFYRALNIYQSSPKEEKYLAASDLEEALKYDPKNSDTLEWLGAISKENQKPEKALDSYEKVLQLSPDRVYLYLPIAKLQFETRRYEQALKSIETGIVSDGGNFELYEQRAEIQLKLGVKEAEVQRNLAAGYAEAGDALRRLGKGNEAFDAYGKSLDIFIKFAKDQSPAETRCDLAQTVSKISRAVGSSQSKQKAIDFWQAVVASGHFKGYEEVLQTEIRRLTNSH
jgi:tetratricopeptide (TPR) repeat protein